ncbi:MAG: LytTR family DNA-binding domain-containing protein [Bacteroidota bacterium]
MKENAQNTLVVIDDEKNVRKTIKGIIRYHIAGVEIAGEADSVKSGLELLSSIQPDIILLDVQMGDGSGFDLIRQIPEIKSKIIFITAYDQYAIKAFEINAVSYLLKPIDPELLEKAIQKAKDMLALENQQVQLENLLSQSLPEKKPVQNIILKTTDAINVIRIANIIRCEANRNYTVFNIIDKPPIMVSNTLKDYERILQDHRFFRIHQSHLINLEHLDRYVKKDGGFVIMSDGSSLPVSSRRKEELFHLLDNMT